MAKYNNKSNNTNQKNNNANHNRIKPVTKGIPFVVTGVDNTRNMQYDPSQVYDIVNTLQNNEIFKILCINATMPKATCFNNKDLKGQINVARIENYDNDGNMSCLFIGKNAEFATLTDGMVIVPRIRMNRDGSVESIISFDIVPEMEA